MQKQQLKLRCLFILSLLVVKRTDAQQDTASTTHTSAILYTGIYNKVNHNYRYPMIGIINKINGAYKGLQLGAVNLNGGNFKGVQTGFLNQITKNSNGLQAGFINLVAEETKGLQLGFINRGKIGLNGVQLGFLNTITQHTKGIQLGFVNESKKNLKGLQTGFVNHLQTLNGVQIGFLNVADSIAKGVPLGFLSIVKKGGYQALEFSVSELFPFNITLKTGIPKLYSFIQLGYLPGSTESFGLGTGLGSLITLNKKLYFNPELSYQSGLSKNKFEADVLATLLRYKISPGLLIGGGLSFVHLRQGNNKTYKPYFTIANTAINQKSQFIIGSRIGITYNFSPLK